MSKRIYCAWCGEDLGEKTAFSWPGDIDSCGKVECNREVANMERERQQDARERAEQDGYSRYGGDGW